MRVVSVLPSATEIVFALGHGAELVGRSAECDYPPAAEQLPVVMRPRVDDSSRTSSQIDQRVRAERAANESLYSLDVDQLARLRPDLLVTQDLCGVCSVTGDEVRTACAAAGVHPEILSLSPRTLEEVWSSIEKLSDALRDGPAGRRLADRLRTRAPRPAGNPRPRVAIVEWLDPPMLAGLWTPEIVRAGGGEPLGPRPGAPGERTTWSSLAAEGPDLVILSPCSFRVDRTLRELGDRRLAEAIARLRPRSGIYVADEAYFSRPGPRLADGVQLIDRLIRGAGPAPALPVERWTVAIAEASA